MRKEENHFMISQLKGGNEKVLTLIYGQYFDECCKWVNKHFGSRDIQFDDVYQDAVISLYEAAQDGKLDDINCSIKTYLFAICRNVILKNFNLQKKQDAKIEQVSIYERQWLEPDESNDHEVALVKSAIETTDEPCKSILTLAYYHGKNNDEIANHLGYPNKNVVKVQKSRCLNYLREKVFKEWKNI